MDPLVFCSSKTAAQGCTARERDFPLPEKPPDHIENLEPACPSITDSKKVHNHKSPASCSLSLEKMQILCNDMEMNIDNPDVEVFEDISVEC